MAMTDTKKKIMDAAEKLFAEHSVDGASLRTITDAAGVNLGSIYYYFENKEQLVKKVLERRVKEFISRGSAEIAAMKKYDLKPSVMEVWLVTFGSLLEFRKEHIDYVKFVQHMQFHNMELTLEVLQGKADQYVTDILELIMEHIQAEKRSQAIIRCRLMLEMFFQVMLNYDMVRLGISRDGVDLDGDSMATELAKLATASLSEFIDQPSGHPERGLGQSELSQEGMI